MSDEFQIGPARFRRWGEGESTEVMAYGAWTHVPEPAAQAIRSLQEENKRLREALVDISHLEGKYKPVETLAEVIEHARATLAGEEPSWKIALKEVGNG